MAITASRRWELPNPFARLITDQNYMWWVSVPVMLGMFVVIIDSSIINVALAPIMAAFGSSVEDIEWVSTGYMLSAAVMMPTTGFLGDRFGRKKLYALTIFLFTIFSMMCGAAWSTGSLVFFRVMQGIAGGAIQPIGQSIMFEAFPPNKRGISMALVGLGAMFAPMIGPTLGGYLVDYLNWRWIFYINLIPGMLATFLVLTIVRESKLRTVKFDLWGFASMAIFLSTFLLGISQGNTKGWHSYYIVGLFAVAAVAFGLFLIVEFWNEDPVVDLTLFKYRTYTAGTLASVAMGIGLFGGLFILPLFLQNLMGLDALQTGLLMMPSGLAMGVVMPISGAILDRVDPRFPLILGLGLMSFSLFLQSTMTPETSYWTVVGWTMLRSMGMAFAFPAMNQTALGAVPIKKIGQASGLFNVVRQVGGSFGIAILSTILTQRQVFHSQILGQAMKGVMAGAAMHGFQGMLMAHGSNMVEAQQQAGLIFGMFATKQAVVQAFQDGFWVAGMIALIGSIPSLFITRDPEHYKSHGSSPMMVE